ncbi:MAG TPA: hypothetical protein VKX49_12665 [Bryobacteraceae bacterium]|nr:hypothetical protein [Bryobacteraceae bacterium]
MSVTTPKEKGYPVTMTASGGQVRVVHGVQEERALAKAGWVRKIVEPYVHQELPTWMYHPNGSSRIVKTQEEFERLSSEGWFVNPPAAFSDPRPKIQPPPSDLPANEQLERQARLFDQAYGELKEKHIALAAEHEDVKAELKNTQAALAEVTAERDRLQADFEAVKAEANAEQAKK